MYAELVLPHERAALLRWLVEESSSFEREEQARRGAVRSLMRSLAGGSEKASANDALALSLAALGSVATQSRSAPSSPRASPQRARPQGRRTRSIAPTKLELQPIAAAAEGRLPTPRLSTAASSKLDLDLEATSQAGQHSARSAPASPARKERPGRALRQPTGGAIGSTL